MWRQIALLILWTNIGYVSGGGEARYCPTNITASEVDPACHCNDDDSFLGVANSVCISFNINTSCVLTFLIVALSFLFEQVTHTLKHFSHDTQMQRIIDTLLEEVMILGFISMTFFVMMVNGVNGFLAKQNCKIRESEGRECLTTYQLFHFQEFFHYAIFLTMVYYIISVSCLVRASNFIPKLWQRTETRLRSLSKPSLMGDDDEHASLRARSVSSKYSGEAARNAGDDGISDDVVTSRYAELKDRRRVQGWRIKLRPRHWWNWWLCVVRMGYKLARSSSTLVYKNPELMAQAFNIPLNYDRTYTYPQYNVRCTRSVLLRVLRVHWSSWAVLWILMIIYTVKRMVTGENGQDITDPWANVKNVVVAGIWMGFILMIFALLLAAKSFKILMGLINDRVDIARDNHAGSLQATISSVEGVHMMDSTWQGVADEHAARASSIANSAAAGGGVSDADSLDSLPVLRSRARTMIQEAQEKAPKTPEDRVELMRKHRSRFWFGSPKLLLQMVQCSFFFQSIYLAIVSLVLVEVAGRVWLGFGAVLIVFFPIVILFVITPFTLPTLVLSLDLTGYIGADRLGKLEAKDTHGHGHGHSHGGVHGNNKNKSRLRVGSSSRHGAAGGGEGGHDDGAEGEGGHGGDHAHVVTVQRRKKVRFCPVCGDGIKIAGEVGINGGNGSSAGNASASAGGRGGCSGVGVAGAGVVVDKNGRWDCDTCGAESLPAYIITKEKKAVPPDGGMVDGTQGRHGSIFGTGRMGRTGTTTGGLPQSSKSKLAAVTRLKTFVSGRTRARSGRDSICDARAFKSSPVAGTTTLENPAFEMRAMEGGAGQNKKESVPRQSQKRPTDVTVFKEHLEDIQ